MEQATSTFWFQRGPYDKHGETGWSRNIVEEHNRYLAFLKRLTPFNLRHVKHIELVLQMHKFDEIPRRQFLPRFFLDPTVKHSAMFRPKIFHVTIRHNDWWDWERGAPLRLKIDSVQHLLDTPQLASVEEIRLELEVLETKKAQLDALVEQLAVLKGRPIRLDRTTVSTAIFRGRSESRWDNAQDFGPSEYLAFYVVTLSWHTVRSGE